VTHSAHELDPNAMLRRAGFRVTAPRVAVLKSLAVHRYSTVDDIVSDVRGMLGSVSTQAVYEVLRACVSAGLVRSIEPAGSSARYETRTGDTTPSGVRLCGRVVDVDEAEVVIWGTCFECRVAEKSVESAQPR
jgi:Fur family transcriptional regulator, stress-responsive regulator